MTNDSSHHRAVAAHVARWGAPQIVVRAPGRVNLIGEHTDYNDGFALPMALPFDTVLAIGSDGDRVDGVVTIVSDGFGEVVIDPSADPRSTAPWARYVAGAVLLLREQGVPTGGWRATIDTDIPTGASLSSSAAIEVATIVGLLARAGTSWSPIEIARLGQRIENEIVGVPSGIMDQFISAGAVDGHASLMDCRELTLTPTAIPDEVVIAILDSRTRRELVDGEYGDRRAACERAVAELGIRTLRDATLDQVAQITDPLDRRRAHHVVTENQRTLDAVTALRSGDTGRLGTLMTESHTSLRDDYAVSGPGLDAIVDVALDAPGCLGARMTGGGFAGCAVALVTATRADEFERDLVERYEYDGLPARVWICAPSAGATVLAG
ncbi:MAG: galactokinase [Ilumatobacteraceae bacterium]